MIVFKIFILVSLEIFPSIFIHRLCTLFRQRGVPAARAPAARHPEKDGKCNKEFIIINGESLRRRRRRGRLRGRTRASISAHRDQFCETTFVTTE